MKRIIALLISALLCVLVFTGCDWFNNPNNPTESTNTSGDGDEDYEKRLAESEKFVEDFYNYLSTADSYKSSAQEIADKYNNVNNVEVKNNTSNDSFRVYWVSGDPTLYGNLEKEWTFIQWKDGDSICTKELEAQSSKKARSAIINPEGFAIIGYDNVYSNKYLYISLFTLSGKDVKDREQGGALENEKYIFEKSENDIFISSILFKDIYFDNLGDGFKIYDNNSEVTLGFGTELTMK